MRYALVVALLVGLVGFTYTEAVAQTEVSRSTWWACKWVFSEYTPYGDTATGASGVNAANCVQLTWSASGDPHGYRSSTFSAHSHGLAGGDTASEYRVVIIPPYNVRSITVACHTTVTGNNTSNITEYTRSRDGNYLNTSQITYSGGWSHTLSPQNGTQEYDDSTTWEWVATTGNAWSGRPVTTDAVYFPRIEAFTSVLNSSAREGDALASCYVSNWSLMSSGSSLEWVPPDAPTPTPTNTTTPTFTNTPTDTPTFTNTPTDTPTPTNTNTPVGTPTPTRTPTRTNTPTWTPTQTFTPFPPKTPREDEIEDQVRTLFVTHTPTPQPQEGMTITVDIVSPNVINIPEPRDPYIISPGSTVDEDNFLVCWQYEQLGSDTWAMPFCQNIYWVNIADPLATSPLYTSEYFGLNLGAVLGGLNNPSRAKMFFVPPASVVSFRAHCEYRFSPYVFEFGDYAWSISETSSAGYFDRTTLRFVRTGLGGDDSQNWSTFDQTWTWTHESRPRWRHFDPYEYASLFPGYSVGVAIGQGQFSPSMALLCNLGGLVMGEEEPDEDCPQNGNATDPIGWCKTPAVYPVPPTVPPPGGGYIPPSWVVTPWRPPPFPTVGPPVPVHFSIGQPSTRTCYNFIPSFEFGGWEVFGYGIPSIGIPEFSFCTREWNPVLSWAGVDFMGWGLMLVSLMALGTIYKLLRGG